MKKYIVKEVYNDDNSIYFDTLKEDLINNFAADVFIGFNKEYNGINEELLKTIDDELIDYSDYNLEVYYKNNFASYIIDNLRSYKKISLKQALKIAALIKNYSINSGSYRSYKHFELICNILSIIYSKRFEYTCLRGCVQSDWIYCFYSSDITKEYINYIEAVLFATGIEFFITDDKINIDPSIDIDNLSYEADGSFDYCSYYNDKELKKYISDNYGIKEEDIALYRIKDVKTITSYKINYEEVK